MNFEELDSLLTNTSTVIRNYSATISRLSDELVCVKQERDLYEKKLSDIVSLLRSLNLSNER